MSENFRAESRKDWHRLNGAASTEELQLGCLQRIADATEMMAKNHDQLVRDRDMYRRWYEQEKAAAKRLVGSVNALRGVITKMRRARAAA
jgi:hypothetical protein